MNGLGFTDIDCIIGYIMCVFTFTLSALGQGDEWIRFY